MDSFPSALVIASYESVCHNNNVLYRLVRSLPDGSGVQSTDRLVNVVPFRRKYTFERKQQLMEFGQEMLRRPLVLQPVLHFGRGLGSCCPTCYDDELWLVMVNQTHPKILSRLQMGLDSAKVAMERGQPFKIKFLFGKLIQRVYQEHLVQKEQEEAQASSSTFLKYLTYFRYAEWEHCDLILRCHGCVSALSGTSALQSLPNLEMKWDFEDIGMHEMVWSQFSDQEVYPRPNLSPISEDEIRQLLPGWTVNGVTPLENIGDSIPEYNYDYAQAGRLYASFRQKRQPRNIQQPQTHPEPSLRSADSSNKRYQEVDFGEELVGAVGSDPSAVPANVATEHDLRYLDISKSKPPSQSRQRYQDQNIAYSDEELDHQDTNKPSSNQSVPQHPYYNNPDSGSNQRSTGAHYALTQSAKGTHQPKSPVAISRPDRYGHIYSNVEIRTPKAQPHQNQSQASISIKQYAEPDARFPDMHESPLSNYHPTFVGPLKKQDSDRSSRSTVADSGYCPEGDSDRSRGGSYDYNEQSQGYVPRLKQDHQGYENFPARSVDDSGGLVNPAFNLNDYDRDHAVQKNKQHLSQLNQHDGSKQRRPTGSPSDHSLNYSNQESKSPYVLSPKEFVGDVIRAPPRQKRITSSSSTPQVAESFI